jgi:virginiamycin B lyase
MRKGNQVQKTRQRTWLLCGLVACLLAVAALAFLPTDAVAAQSPTCPPPLVQRQRYGYVATADDWPQDFDYPYLKGGWSVDTAFASHSTTPGGMDRAWLLRVYTGYTVNPGVLGPLVDDNPGVIWLVGNEPDSIWQDDVLPEEYARIYHDVYTFIKNRDRASQVSPGGIVQPTPLRLEYLDRVLVAYQAQHGQPMPVDVWNIHNAILDELRGRAGADIPPGIDADVGVRRSVDDNDNMTIFEDQIWAFRQWMADRGYAGYPLIVTEYGVLMGEAWYPQFDAARVNAFMSNTFAFFENATDPLLGDPADDYRLVQRWAWFSLDVQPFDPNTFEGYNGNLFDPQTAAITAHGENYATHTASFPSLSYVDLGLGLWTVQPASDLVSPTQTITRSLRAKILNLGTVDSGPFTVTLEYDGPLSGTLGHTIDNLAAVSSRWLTFTMVALPRGVYTASLWVDVDDQVTESRECNNQATTSVIAPVTALYLPLVSRTATDAMAGVQSAGSASTPGEAPGVWPAAASGFQEFDLPTANSYPAQIAIQAGAGGPLLWVSERDGNKIARFDPQAGTDPWDEYSIPSLGSEPWGLAVDGSGNVWFAETAANRIGKLEVASGVISEYTIPTANSQPWEVAIGGDGTVWFTEKAGNKIGSLAPSTRAVTEYTLPTDGAEPAGIAIQGIYVWFTESAAHQIGRLKTLDGTIYEFQPDTPASAPQDIVISPGGNPWFTERAADQLSLFRISTLGLFIEIPVHTPSSEPYGIAMEGDAAVWFTERSADRLGRYTGGVPPDEFSLPTPNSQPTSIVVDGDGCAWYAAPAMNRIGRLCPSLQHLVYLPLVVRDSP